MADQLDDSPSEIVDDAREFLLDGHRFCFLEETEGPGADLEPGYYEAAYGPGTEIWARWKKTFAEGSQGKGRFEQSRTFFIKNRNISICNN